MKRESFGSWGLEATKMRDDFGGFPTRQRPVLSELVMFGNVAPAAIVEVWRRESRDRENFYFAKREMRVVNGGVLKFLGAFLSLYFK